MKPGERRRLLLLATVGEIARVGTRGVRVESVAAEAGVSPALIYHHFGDRSGLLVAALEHVGDMAHGYTARPRRRGTGLDRVRAALLAEIQDNALVRTNSAAWGELRDAAIFDGTLRPTISRLTEEWSAAIADLVQEGCNDGSISAIAGGLTPQSAAHALTALVEGISGRWLNGSLSTREARARLRASIDATLASPFPGGPAH